jgi:hypothetical protein
MATMILTKDDNVSSMNRGVVRLYLLLIPGALTISAAMGYDGSLMNGIQGVDRWLACESRLRQT